MRQDPNSVLDYTVDWRPAKVKSGEVPFLAAGETITASTWTVAPAGPTQPQSASHDGTTATIWLTGGTVGQRYQITNHITTSAGRQSEKSFPLDIRDL